MSYSIDEAISDARERLASLRDIAKHYPEATLQDLPNGERVWCADGAEADATDIYLVADKKGEVYFCAYAQVGKHGRVYGHYASRSTLGFMVLQGIKQSSIADVIKYMTTPTGGKDA